MILTGAIIAVVLAFSAAVSLRDGIVPLWAFLGLTGGGIAAGLLLYAVRPAGLRWLLIALVVGLAVALRISAMPGAMAPWLLGVVAGSFLSRDEWPWRRSAEERQRERQPRPLASIRPWSGSGLTASLAEVPIGRRGASETGVLLAAGDVTARVRVDELHRLVTGRASPSRWTPTTPTPRAGPSTSRASTRRRRTRSWGRSWSGSRATRSRSCASRIPCPRAPWRC
jgi:hypothetical protein